ncbi:MAG: hypothetical protein E6K76_12220 [Candidatus Eisenbacteria bacterium]|uniref:Uncharacterized protein n=1 Tax=Eiseniibacteriota bacterium TaxID=2212470 RepID=A0A538SZF2_UNCEI|nr:MAG: hypothetical protein E6K76_12220 [Candidatus Eisenbacteria bacterium]
MRSRIRFFFVAFCVVVPSIGWCHKPMEPGVPYFGLGLSISVVPHIGQIFPLRARAGSSQHGVDCLGDVRIEVPSGIEVLAGDTSRKVHVSRWEREHFDQEWVVSLRVSRTGKYRIRGELRIPCGEPTVWDESETLVDLDVRQDTTLVHGGYDTRFERIRDGKRFRYGGGHLVRVDSTNALIFQRGHMVLIDSTEALLPDDISERPLVMSAPHAKCPECGLVAPKALRFIVTVGSNGSVTWIESRPAAETPPVLASAEQALKRYVFRPARAKGGRPVADWAEVEVIVEP